MMKVSRETNNKETAMLAARRKKADAATTTTTTTTTAAPKAEAKAKPAAAAKPAKAAKPATAKPAKKKVKVEGSMRTIALGRSYKEFEAVVDDNGLPKARAYFDAVGKSAAALPKDFDKTKSVPLKDLIKHLNETVYKPIFGQALRSAVARDVILGTFDSLLSLSENDFKYKIPNFLRAETKTRAERKAHNPKTGASIKVKAKKVVTFKATRAVRDYISNS
jgi:nucleoid DNA-binding protein